MNISLILRDCGVPQVKMQELAHIYPDILFKQEDGVAARQPITSGNMEVVFRRANVRCRMNQLSKEMEVRLYDYRQDERDYKPDPENPLLDHDMIRMECGFGVNNQGFGIMLLAAVRDRIRTELRASINVKDLTFEASILAVGNVHHPIADWIQSKHWDGVDRWQEFYKCIEEAPDNDGLKETYMHKWALQGCQAWIGNGQTASPQQVGQTLVLVGTEGIGKSEFFKSLLPDGYVGEISLHLGNKSRVQESDSIATASSYGIAEIDEFDATLQQTAFAALKRYLTSVIDQGRKSYSQVEFKHPRQTIHGGTVNKMEYLKDADGARRIWTIPVVACKSCLMGTFDVNMQQLFAQAYVEWMCGADYFLNAKEAAVHRVSVSGFLEQHPKATTLRDIIAAGQVLKVPVDWYNMTRICELLDISFSDRRTQSELRAVMKEMGCEFKKKHEGKQKVWGISWGTVKEGEAIPTTRLDLILGGKLPPSGSKIP